MGDPKVGEKIWWRLINEKADGNRVGVPLVLQTAINAKYEIYLDRAEIRDNPNALQEDITVSIEWNDGQITRQARLPFSQAQIIGARHLEVFTVQGGNFFAEGWFCLVGPDA